MTEQFNDLVSLLTDKRLNGNLGTKYIEDKEREEDKLPVLKPSICEVEPFVSVTRGRQREVETSERTKAKPSM